MKMCQKFKALAVHNVKMDQDGLVALSENVHVASATVYGPQHFMAVHLHLRPQFARLTQNGEHVVYARLGMQHNGHNVLDDHLFIAPMSELAALKAAVA